MRGRLISQKNVLTFTTEPLSAPVEWTGKVQTEVYLTSTAKDTDVIVRVSDVYPDGRSILIIDYVRRARYATVTRKKCRSNPAKWRRWRLTSVPSARFSRKATASA